MFTAKLVFADRLGKHEIQHPSRKFLESLTGTTRTLEGKGYFADQL